MPHCQTPRWATCTARGAPLRPALAADWSAAVWTFFGQNDTSFTSQAYPGQYGDEQVAFWREKHDCSDAEVVRDAGGGECVRYEGCTVDTRYCFYGPEAGHQIPDYFAAVILTWFRGF